MGVIRGFIPTDKSEFGSIKYYICDLESELPSAVEGSLAYTKDSNKFWKSTGPGAWSEVSGGGSGSVTSAEIAVIETNVDNLTSSHNTLYDIVSNMISAGGGGVSVTSAELMSVDARVDVVSNQVSVLSQAVSAVSNAASAAEVHASTASAAATSADAHAATASAAATSVDARVNTVSNQVSVILQQVSALSQVVSLISQAVSNEISNRISAIDVVSNAASVADAHASTASAAATSVDGRVNTVSNQVSAISQQVSVLSNVVSAISQRASVTSNALSALEVRVSTLSTAAANSVTSNEVSVLVQVASAAATSADGHAAAASAAATSVDTRVNAISNQVSILSQAVSVLSQAVSVASNLASVADAHASIASLAATSVDARVNTVSNDLSNEISNRISAVNVVSQTHSALSQVVSLISQAVSNEISNRISAINVVSNAASVADAHASVASAAATSVDTRVNAISNQVSVLSQAHSALSAAIRGVSNYNSVTQGELGLHIAEARVSTQDTQLVLSLPALSAAIAGKRYHIVKVDGNAVNVRIEPTGTDTIEGSPKFDIGTTQWDDAVLVADGVSNWSLEHNTNEINIVNSRVTSVLTGVVPWISCSRTLLSANATDISATALTKVPGLSATVVSGAAYKFEAMLLHLISNATANTYGIGLSIPTLTKAGFEWITRCSAVAAGGLFASTIAAHGYMTEGGTNSIIISTVASTATNMTLIMGVFKCAANGSLNIKARVSAATAPITFLDGSYVMIYRLN